MRGIKSILFALAPIFGVWFAFLFIEFFLRIGFYLFNLSFLANANFLTFLHGIRFDLVSSSYLLLPFFVGYFLYLFFDLKKLRPTLPLLFLIGTGISIGLNLIDFEYFKFTQKRSTADIFEMVFLGDFMVNLTPVFLVEFWYLLPIGLVTLFAGWYIFRRIPFPIPSIVSLKEKAIVTIFWAGLFILFSRGGTQLKPIHIMDASQFGLAAQAPIVLNTPFSIIKTLGSKELPIDEPFENKELYEIVNPIKKYNLSRDLLPKNTNVVIVILESFSKEFLRRNDSLPSLTPFFDKLEKESVNFTHSFANGKKSIDALPSILSSIPALTDQAFSTSSYSGNNIEGLPKYLKKHGYQTAFYHGGTTGTMGFNSFSAKAGVDQYIGSEDYPDQNDFDGNWGIWDDKFLPFSAKEMTQKKQPFFGAVFSLSSHHPYNLPDKFSLPPSLHGITEMEKTIYYADQALEAFFNVFKNSAVYKNTLFVVTADHTPKSNSSYYNNSYGRYEVPILFHHKNLQPGKNDSITAQQADIFPTVVQLLGFEETFYSLGNSLFEPKEPHFAVNYLNGYFQLFQYPFVIRYNQSGVLGFFDVSKDKRLKKPINVVDNEKSKELETLIKGYLQHVKIGLTQNKMTSTTP